MAITQEPPVKVVVNPTPKQRFLLDKNMVRFHNDTMFSAQMDALLDATALYHAHVINHAQISDPAAAYWQLRGAADFVELLKTIGITPRSLPQSPIGILNHQV